MKRRSLTASGLAGLCLAAVIGSAPGVVACEPPEPRGDVVPLGGLPTLVVQGPTNRAQGWLYLKNAGEGEIPLVMTLGSFLSDTTGRPMATEAVFFTGDEAVGRPFVQSRLEPGETLRVKLEVSNLWEAGESSAKLSINGIDHTLRAVNVDVPFKVGLQSATPEKPSLTLQRDRSGLMVLKNDDPQTYAVSWWLAIPNESATLRGKALLPPKSAQPIVIEAPAVWFGGWFEGLFKDAERSALLNSLSVPGQSPAVVPSGPRRPCRFSFASPSGPMGSGDSGATRSSSDCCFWAESAPLSLDCGSPTSSRASSCSGGSMSSPKKPAPSPGRPTPRCGWACGSRG